MADSLLPEDNSDTVERQVLLDKWKDKTKEELLEAKINSDLFIKSQNARFDDIKRDYLELRERQQASEDLKVLLDQMKKQQSGQFTDNQPPKVTEQPPAIKPEDIETLVKKHAVETFTERERIKQQQQNFNLVQTRLKEVFGDNYESSYKQKLTQLGLTKEFADNLAKDHPTVFMKTFELDQVKPLSNLSPPRSNQRPTSFAPSVQKRDWNYYQELKKQNPKLYLDPKIAIQMHNDAIELGSDFGMPQD
jgi:hypothetical protein